MYRAYGWQLSIQWLAGKFLAQRNRESYALIRELGWRTGWAKSHYARDGVAAILGLTSDKVHGSWKLGAGSKRRPRAEKPDQ